MRPTVFAVLNGKSHVYCLIHWIVILRASKRVVASCIEGPLHGPVPSEWLAGAAEDLAQQGALGGVVFNVKSVLSVGNDQGVPKIEKALCNAERKNVRIHVRAHSAGCSCLKRRHRIRAQQRYTNIDDLQSAGETEDEACKMIVTLDRQERQRKARAVRRALADITPANSWLQDQSLFFSRLPAEIRYMIYQLLLSQKHDHERPVDFHSISPLYRPGHTYRTKVHTAILLTCRLIYHEAHAIPIKSATHHFRHLGSTSWLYEGDVWLHHMTKQRGADLYHLHDNLVALNRRNFTKFFLPHLHWKRVTWTICAYLWPPILAGYREIDRLAGTLAGIELPASCQEVNLEFEIREDVPEFRESLLQQAELCQRIGVSPDANVQSSSIQPESLQQPAGLTKADRTTLQFDASYSKRYTWIGSGQARWGTSALIREKETVRYRTVRLCWRAKVPRRDYMSYDHMDCLDLTECEGWKGIEEENVEDEVRQLS